MENHNMSKSRIYSVWRAMKKRCYREKDQEYKAYGSRGIQVCNEWKNSFLSFYNWSMQNGYTEETMANNRNRLTLDRINNDGNYEPSNCRWVTRDEQDKNRANNFIVKFKDKQYTISELSEMCDIDRTTLYERIAFLGWNIEDAMTRPIRKIKGKKKEFMDKYYLIRDKKSGCYLVNGREWTKDIELATRYKSKKLAERSISNSYLMALMDCEVVELPSRAEIFADLETKLAEMTEKYNACQEARKLEIEFNKQDKAELKQQLAKSEERVKDLEFRNKNLEHSLKVAPNANAGQRQRIVELKEINQKLKQQLAEKETRIAELEDKDWYEATIKQLEEQNERLIKERDSANAQNKRVLEKLDLIVRSNQELEQQLDKKDDEILKGDCAFVKEVYNSEQDKISFALEKLKETQIYVDNQHFMNARYKCEKKVYADIWNFIDNQIKAIKGDK